MKKKKSTIVKISIIAIVLLLVCATIAVPKYINKLDEISEFKAATEGTSERKIHGIYTSDNQQITEIGRDGTFVIGDYIDIYCFWTYNEGDTLELITDEPDVIGISDDGVNGCNRITAKSVGTALLRYRCAQDTSVYSDVYIIVSNPPERQIFGIYTSDNQQITEIGRDGTFVVGDYIDIYCNFTFYEGDTLELITDEPNVIGISDDGVNGCNRITAKSAGTALLRYRCAQDTSVYSDVYIIVSNPPEKQIFGIYKSDGQEITDIGADGSFYVGNTIDVYSMYNKIEGNQIVVATDNYDIIEITPGAGENGCDRVTAKSEGTTILQYYYTQDTSVHYEIPVTVSAQKREIYGIYNSDNQQIENIGLVDEFYVGDTIDIYCYWFKGDEDTLGITTDNYDIIDISIGAGKNGCDRIIAKSEGTAVLKYYCIQDPSVYCEIPIEIKAPKTDVEVKKITLNKDKTTIKIGDTLQLSATITPTNATNKKVTWSTRDSSIASVNSDGLVTAISTGTVKIYATSQSDTSVKAECEVTVIAKETESAATKVEQGKDEDGNFYVYIENKSDKEIEKVTVNGKEITTKDENGRYYFYTTENGEYRIVITYTDSSTEEIIYTETRFSTDENKPDEDNTDKDTSDKDNIDKDTSDKDNTDKDTSDEEKEGTDSSVGNKKDDEETGKSSSTSDKTKTSLSSLPYAGIKEGILIFLSICGIVSIFAWFKSRDIKY